MQTEQTNTMEQLDGQLWGNAFFDTLHAAGKGPQNEKQAMAMISIAQQLRELREVEAVKSASSTDNYLTAIDAQLRQLTGGQSGVAEADAFRAQKAAELAAHPDVFNTILAGMASEASKRLSV